MQFFAFEKLAHSVHPVRSERANGAAVEPHAAGYDTLALYNNLWANGAAVEPHAAGARQRPCKCRL
jgi:hypothetical protein